VTGKEVMKHSADRHYDFENNYAGKEGEKIGAVSLNFLLVFAQKMIIKLVCEKNAIFSPKNGQSRRKNVIVTSIPGFTDTIMSNTIFCQKLTS
jgi:hypothetical protein